MRPGQTAPEFIAEGVRGARVRPGFNEAGADCPGIPVWRPLVMFHSGLLQ